VRSAFQVVVGAGDAAEALLDLLAVGFAQAAMRPG